MSEEEIRFPDLNYGENNKKQYEDLIISEWSPFFNHTIWEVFIFCMSYAFAKKLSLTGSPTGTTKGINAKVLSQPTRYLMRTLAIQHYQDIKVIKDSTKVAKICEQYANAGIQELYPRLLNKPSEVPPEQFFIDLQNEIIEHNI